jgi:hypothetical protein
MGLTVPSRQKPKRLASAGKRKLHIAGEVWTYTLNRGGARIVNPDRTRSYYAGHNLLTGMSWSEIERAKWKHYWKGVEPSQVKDWICEGVALRDWRERR